MRAICKSLLIPLVSLKGITCQVQTVFPTILQTLLLGLIQGSSEWLPISSTAHLTLTERFLGLAVTPLFNLVLHLGTISVLIFYFRQEVKSIFSSLMHLDFNSESGMLISRIIVATIPTAAIGLAYNLFLTNQSSSFYQSSLETIPAIAVTFLIGATIVFSTKFAKEDKDYLSYKMAMVMGIAQGFAIFPGLSRSGVTISVALMLGLQRKKAFKFSFLLSIPAILGDLVVEGYQQRGQFGGTGLEPLDLAVGVAAAIVVGYFALKLVSKVIQGRKFHYFAFYTWALGIALLLWTLLGH
jgi:undecaprenyl-diphosphatase